MSALNVDELEDILALSTDRTAFDFAPFLTAPAVQNVASASANAPVIIHIPPTPCPSPLAPNLSPQTIKNLHDHLCGPANGNNSKQLQRGKEIWLSWKRAWDLWNNHYIEGRVDPLWIGQEYRNLKMKFEKDRKRLNLEQQNRMNFRRRGWYPETQGLYLRRFSRTAPRNRAGRKWVTTGCKGKVVRMTGQLRRVAHQGDALIEVPDHTKTTVERIRTPPVPMTYPAHTAVPVVLKNVPAYTTNLEYIIVAKPVQPLVLRSYRELRDERRLSMEVNTNAATDFSWTEDSAKASDAELPPNTNSKVTVARSPVEDAVEDSTTEIKQEAVKCRVGGGAAKIVFTEPYERTRVLHSYASITKRRAGGNGVDVVQPADDCEVPTLEGRMMVRPTSTEDLVKYTNGARVMQTYQEDFEGFDLTGNNVELVPLMEYASAAENILVDEWEAVDIPEWKEVNAPNPRRQMQSNTHSAPRNSQENIHMKTKTKAKANRSVRFSDASDIQDRVNDNSGEDSALPDTQHPTVAMADHPIDTATDSPSGSSDDVSDDDSDDLALFPVKRKLNPGNYLIDQNAPVPLLDASDVQAPDGSSGGFIPMKNLPEYRVPDPDPITEQYPEWHEVLQNTVWRPRRVGEKTLKIDMDRDIDEISETTDLELGGGVDCGRSPYPVLRPVTKYFKFGSPLNQAFLKKKVWDGVTGTIFNMPTKPVEDDSRPEDERMVQMKALYSDQYRNKCSPRKDIFPLDIRRVDRINTNTIKRKSTPLIPSPNSANEIEIEYPWQNPVRCYDDLSDADPWWVTTEQERLRDVPPRKYPPQSRNADDPDNNGELIYTDDTKWKEELENDDLYHSRYFVTNLHGGTLIINGAEVRKGCIAGPLPEFAVIECPGDQVAFWFGSGGRFYGQGSENASHEIHWATLRQMDGWKNIGLSAGQVWNQLINDRLRRELTGNKLEDDEDWETWKKLEPAPAGPNFSGPIEFPRVELAVVRDDIPRGLSACAVANRTLAAEPFDLDSFRTDSDELRWLITRAEPLAKAAAIAVKDHAIRMTQWTLGDEAIQPVPPEIDAQQVADMNYAETEASRCDCQRLATASYISRKNARDEEQAEYITKAERSRKRKHDEIFPQPLSRKTRKRLDNAVADASRSHTQKVQEAKMDESIWQQFLLNKVQIARYIEEGKTASDWEICHQDYVHGLQRRWDAKNEERRNLNPPLPPLAGPSPREREDIYNHCVSDVVKRYRDDPKAGKQRQIQKRRHLKTAQNKAEQAKTNAVRKKRVQETKRREEGLSIHEKRQLQRQKSNIDSRMRLRNGISLRRLETEKAANAARLNRAINGSPVFQFSQQTSFFVSSNRPTATKKQVRIPQSPKPSVESQIPKPSPSVPSLHSRNPTTPMRSNVIELNASNSNLPTPPGTTMAGNRFKDPGTVGKLAGGILTTIVPPDLPPGSPMEDVEHRRFTDFTQLYHPSQLANTTNFAQLDPQDQIQPALNHGFLSCSLAPKSMAHQAIIERANNSNRSLQTQLEKENYNYVEQQQAKAIESPVALLDKDTAEAEKETLRRLYEAFVERYASQAASESMDGKHTTATDIAEREFLLTGQTGTFREWLANKARLLAAQVMSTPPELRRYKTEELVLKAAGVIDSLERLEEERRHGFKEAVQDSFGDWMCEL